MTILSDDQYDLLTFIAACNRNSYSPTAEEVMLWWENPEPMEAKYETITTPSAFANLNTDRLIANFNNLNTDRLIANFNTGSSSISKMLETMVGDQNRFAHYLASGPRTRKELVKPAETMLEHLVRLTWLAEGGSDGESPRLYLTELGRALLRDTEQESAPPEDVSVVVFEVEDPLAYPQLVGQLANAGEGLLVDPYLKLADLNRVVVSTGLTRLLVTGISNNKRELAAMQTYLDSPSLGRRVEVRASTQLHDRLLIAEDGSVLTLGSSLNGIGRKLTVLSPIPPSQCSTFRDAYEKIWDDADTVGPTPDNADEVESGIATTTDDEAEPHE